MDVSAIFILNKLSDLGIFTRELLYFGLELYVNGLLLNVSYYLTVPLNEINEVMDVAFGMIKRNLF